jgi:hypothetical protein
MRWDRTARTCRWWLKFIFPGPYFGENINGAFPRQPDGGRYRRGVGA